MKYKFILFLIIQFSDAVNEGSIESNENNKKSDDNKSEGSVSPENEERHKREGSPENAGSHERDEVAEDDTSFDSLSDKEDEMTTSVILNPKFKGTVPDTQGDANEFDSSSNVSLSGNNGLKETDPDTQSPLGKKNFTPENGPSEGNKQSKLEENINTEKQKDKAVDKLEDSESSRDTNINVGQPGVTKSETSPIDNTQSANSIKHFIPKDINIKNNTTSGIEDKKESLNDKKVSEIQEEERSLNITKDVDNSITPLISKGTGTKEVNTETEVFTENLGLKSKINEGNIFNDNKIKESSFDLKNGSSPDIVNKPNAHDNKNSSIDVDKSDTTPFTDGHTINPTIDNEETSKDKDTGILNEKSLDYSTEPLSLNDEHTQTNNIETDSNGKTQSSLKIETENALSEFTSNANPKGNDKESSTVIKTSLDVETESLTDSSKDDETKIISGKDVSVADHSSKVDRESKQNPGSSTKDEETTINNENVSVAGHSLEVDNGNDAKSVSSTTSTETKINLKDVNISGHSSKVERERDTLLNTSTTATETKVNDEDVIVAGHSSKVDIGNDAKLVSSIKDDELNINDKDLNISDHYSSKVDTENTQNLSISTKDNEPEINDKDISVAGHSSEVKKESAIPLNINTKDDETKVNDKDVNIADRSSSKVVIESAKNPNSSTPDIETKVNDKDVSVSDHSFEVDENIIPQISSTKDNDSTINDADLNVAGPSSSSGAGTKPVLLPTNSTVANDNSNNKGGSKESNEEKIFSISKDNSRKRFIKSFNDFQQHINSFNQGTWSIFTGGTASGKVDNNENNTQSVEKDINTSLFDSERSKVNKGTASGEVDNNENITDALNNTKDVNSDQIQGDSPNYIKGTTPEVDNNTIPAFSSINNNSNVKFVEDLIDINGTRAGNDNITSCLSNNPDLKIKGNSNERNENIIVGRLDIMTSPRDQPSTSTSNNNENRSLFIESNNNDTSSNDTSSNDTSSEDYVYERDSRLGTIGSNSESDSFSSFVDSEDQNRLLLGGGMPLGNNRSQTNQPIRLKFTVSRS